MDRATYTLNLARWTREHGVCISWAAILLHCAKGPQTISQMVEALDMPEPTLTRAVHELRDRGFLLSKIVTTRRAKAWHATALAAETMRSILP